jgi:hypothetical protein
VKWEASALLTDYWPCPAEDSANALVTLSRCPHVSEWGFTADTGRVWWTLMDEEGRDCQHLVIKRHVQRCISTHSPQDWPS